MAFESIFDGKLGSVLIGGIGVLIGAVLAWLTRLGKRKVDDVKRKIP